MIALLVAQLGTGGCLFYTKKVDKPPSVVSEDVSVTEGPGEIVFAAASQGRQIQFRATWRQRCVEHRVTHLVKRPTEVRMVGAPDEAENAGLDAASSAGPGGMVVLAIVGIVLLPVALISLIASSAVASSDEQEEVREAERPYDCSRPITAVRALAKLPNGRVLQSLTDTGGVAAFVVPAEEGAGAVTLSLAKGNARPVTIRFGPGVNDTVPPGEGERCANARVELDRCFDGLACRGGRCVAPAKQQAAAPRPTGPASRPTGAASRPSSRPPRPAPPRIIQRRVEQAVDSERPR